LDLLIYTKFPELVQKVQALLRLFLDSICFHPISDFQRSLNPRTEVLQSKGKQGLFTGL
jgi:hypothetical protein